MTTVSRTDLYRTIATDPRCGWSFGRRIRPLLVRIPDHPDLESIARAFVTLVRDQQDMATPPIPEATWLSLYRRLEAVEASRARPATPRGIWGRLRSRASTEAICGVTRVLLDVGGAIATTIVESSINTTGDILRVVDTAGHKVHEDRMKAYKANHGKAYRNLTNATAELRYEVRHDKAVRRMKYKAGLRAMAEDIADGGQGPVDPHE